MERFPRPGHQPDGSEIEDALQSLPKDPKDAVGVITAMMADLSNDAVLEAQAAGSEITPFYARLIAYNLIAHAPDTAPTEALRRYFREGAGTHDQLRAEYLPLRLDPIMQPEGQLLIDALGTHLANQERGGREETLARRLGNASFAILTLEDGTRNGLLFKTRAPISELGATALTLKLSRIAREYGDAFLAYLRAPGVDAVTEDIRGDFITAYIGGTADLASIEDAPDTVSPASWNGVEIGGQLYVFHA